MEQREIPALFANDDARQRWLSLALKPAYTADGHAIPGEGQTAAGVDADTSIDGDEPGWVHATLRMG